MPAILSALGILPGTEIPPQTSADRRKATPQTSADRRKALIHALVEELADPTEPGDEATADAVRAAIVALTAKKSGS